MRTIKELHGAVVRKESSGRKVGKVRHAVFHPSEPRLVGFVIHRHDTAAMIKHPEHFLAFDSFTVRDGLLHAKKEKEAWDDDACARLGVDFESCVVWLGMPMVTPDGTDLGKVSDVEYDEATGEIVRIDATDGPLSHLLVGTSGHDTESFIGYSDGCIILDSSAEQVKAQGGLAEKAGEATAKIANKVKEKTPEVKDNAKKAAKSADDAVQKGAYKFGELLGGTKGMFENFKSEYDKERHKDE